MEHPVERKVTVEAGQQMDARIQELEALLNRAYGFVAFGPASEIARQNMLDAIAKALNWPRIPVEKMIEDLQNWART
jgi:hypothetical protein